MTTLVRSFQNASIRWKLMVNILVVAACAAAIAVTAINLQLSSGGHAAELEAEHVANAIANTGIAGAISDPLLLQRYLESLGKLYERDIMILDHELMIVASTNPKGVGSHYDHPEPRLTAIDGITRLFVGADASSPGLARQVAVPFRYDPLHADSPIVGTVIFEYTLFHDRLMGEASKAAAWTGLAAIFILALGLLLTRHLSQIILRPLDHLKAGVSSLAGGGYGVRVHSESQDEIGQLATAFNDMAEDLDRSRLAAEKHATDLAHANLLLQQEVEKHKAAAQQIEYLAYHDPLTGLPNRTRFGHALGEALRDAHRDGRSLAVFFVDLDRFKQINDTLGHDTGDLLLKEVSARLRNALQSSDVVARLGGDEFLVLVTDLKNPAQAETIARKMLAAIARPFVAGGQELRVTASVGISVYPQDGEDEQTLMKYADVAMYQAKESGRATFAFYAKSSNANTFERLALESSLRRALERGELLLHYQPKRDLTTGAISGMEALVRWKHPDLGMISPAQFIPIAEETGFIVPIGKWVLRTACLQTMQWQAAGLKGMTIAVNLSPRQFADEHLLDDVAAILKETGLDAEWLELEITESMLMQNRDVALKTLSALKRMGIRIAVDDFGTGYSSLSTLKQFPVDTLKIDRSFIRDLETDADDRGLTEAIINMAKTLRLHLVAEGVETQGQSDFLQKRGCDELQGFLFSPPLAPQQFETFVSAFRAAVH